VLEVFSAILALAALGITYRRFQFTSVVYLLITQHACILFVGWTLHLRRGAAV
jgi:uncharacterized membrane protein YjdF